MPATIVATTTADVVNPNDGLVSLREAVTMANATAAPDTIQLNAGVYKITEETPERPPLTIPHELSESDALTAQ